MADAVDANDKVWFKVVGNGEILGATTRIENTVSTPSKRLELFSSCRDKHDSCPCADTSASVWWASAFDKECHVSVQLSAADAQDGRAELAVCTFPRKPDNGWCQRALEGPLKANEQFPAFPFSFYATSSFQASASISTTNTDCVLHMTT